MDEPRCRLEARLDGAAELDQLGKVPPARRQGRARPRRRRPRRRRRRRHGPSASRPRLDEGGDVAEPHASGRCRPPPAPRSRGGPEGTSTTTRDSGSTWGSTPLSSAQVTSAIVPCPQAVEYPALWKKTTPRSAPSSSGSVTKQPYMSAWPRGSWTRSRRTGSRCSSAKRRFSRIVAPSSGAHSTGDDPERLARRVVVDRRDHSGSPQARRADLRRAEGAPPRTDRDLAQALGALPGGRLVLGARPPRRQRVHRLDHDEEEHGRDQEERDQGVQELAVAERALVDREGEPGEVRLAEDRRDQRRDHVLDKRVHHHRERERQHQPNRDLEQVAAKEKSRNSFSTAHPRLDESRGYTGG